MYHLLFKTFVIRQIMPHGDYDVEYKSHKQSKAENRKHVIHSVYSLTNSFVFLLVFFFFATNRLQLIAERKHRKFLDRQRATENHIVLLQSFTLWFHIIIAVSLKIISYANHRVIASSKHFISICEIPIKIVGDSHLFWLSPHFN